MSILAGIVSRNPAGKIPPEWCELLKSTISRSPGMPVHCVSDEQSYLLKADVGAFVGTGVHQGGCGTVSMLVGEPLLASIDQGPGASRDKDLNCLHQAWEDGKWDILHRVRGIFTAAFYKPQTRTLYLVADKLSVRPMYYWATHSWVVFSSAMRILEALPFVPKTMDFRAVTEITCFGFPLGARTPYRDIWTIKASEVLCFEPAGSSSRRYWRWDSIPVSRRPESELLQEAHERFLDSVKVRLHGDRVVTSFLSGGLDSRCVVAALSNYAEKIHTLNCSFPNTQDRVFGAEYAGKMGTLHQEEEMMISHPDFFQQVSRHWERNSDRNQWPPNRPRLIWSGDGGSVGMGHVYMTLNVVDLLRKGKRQEAIREFLRAENKQIVRRLLKPQALIAAETIIEQGVSEAFDDLHSEDPGRDLYIFLLLNDQRRHLANQYERIDLSQIDYVEPFFDSDFLSFVISVPLDLCLLHRFYNKWLKLFPSPVSSVPWQAYPGHEPCTIPQPPGLVSQWNNGRLDEMQIRYRKQLLAQSENVLQHNGFPFALLDKSYLRVAHLAYKWKVRDYGYVLEAAAIYSRYWTTAEGRFVF